MHPRHRRPLLQEQLWSKEQSCFLLVIPLGLLYNLALWAATQLAHSLTYFWGQELLGSLDSNCAHVYGSSFHHVGEIGSIRSQEFVTDKSNNTGPA